MKLQKVNTVIVTIDKKLHFLFPHRCETSYYYYKHCDGLCYRFYDYNTYSVDYLDPEFRIKKDDPDYLKQIETLTSVARSQFSINPVFVKRLSSNAIRDREAMVDLDRLSISN